MFNKYKQVPPQDQELATIPRRMDASAVHAVNFAAPPIVPSYHSGKVPTFSAPYPYDPGYYICSEYKSHNHIRESTSAIWSDYDKWTEYVHPNGSLYWTCSAYPGQVVSDVKPPLSSLDTRAPSTISRIMDGLGEVPLVQDYHNWEIYTDGISCVYIDHGSRTASNGFESLSSFRSQIQKLQGSIDIESKIKLEAAYWTYMQSHPNHRELPEGAIDDTTEALVWCHADRVLFKYSNAPFSQEDAREMTELIKTVADLKRSTLKTWYCATILRAICNSRLVSHYGQNDAREVRRREKAEEVESTLPYDSVRHKIGWYFVTFLLLGVPDRYLRRINNVDRTHSGDGVNTLRWRTFLKLLCKEWTDSNLLATVLVSATVAFLAIQGISGITVIASIVAALHALSSVLCGMFLVSSHQDRVESYGITGLTYFTRAKSRSTGTVRPLAVILSLPISFMLWGMVWFIFAVVSCAYKFPQGGEANQFPTTAVRVTSFVFLCALLVIGAVLLWFYRGIWGMPFPVEQQTQSQSTTAHMVTEQGGNPPMMYSGDQSWATPFAIPVSQAVPLHAGPVAAVGTAGPSEMPEMNAQIRPPHPPPPIGPVAAAHFPPYGQPSKAAPVNNTVVNACLRPPISTSTALAPPPSYTPPPPPAPSTKSSGSKLLLNLIDKEAWFTAIHTQPSYDQLLIDIRREAEKYGEVQEISIPRYGSLAHAQITFGSQAAAGNAFIAFQESGLLGHQVT